MAWYNDVWDYAKQNALELAKIGAGGAKAYIDIQDQKRRNEIEEQAYRDYMANVEAAGKEAQAAIDLNLMPMEISNVPTTKADVSDFTLVAARGGLMNLPTRQRKRYAFGPGPVLEGADISTIEEMDTPFDPREEGVNIGPMAGFPDTGDPMKNAQQVWQSGAIDQGIYQMDFNIFFQSGDWMDHISRGTVQGDTQMASAPSGQDEAHQMYLNAIQSGQFNGTFDEFLEKIDLMRDEVATGGIAGLRHGGRIGYTAGGDMAHRLSELIKKSNAGTITSEEENEMEQLEIMLDYGPGEKDGGRIRKDNGGIMNLGGLEKDYRTTGGFVPIGGRERADDVPARLSKNEFVMTADAVRAAGGGSINKGAQRMYNTMKHLEASPQSNRMIS